ncbi:MAG: hypothetical protein ABJA78_06685 [Ferruginibacter sp.]
MYTNTWSKYLPVIRILLKRAVTSEQKVELSKIDFESGGSRTRKLACSFNVELEKGRFVKLTQSVSAKSLVAVLMEDDVAKSLLQQNHYHLVLNASFQLSIKNLNPPAQEAIAEAAVETADTTEEVSA